MTVTAPAFTFDRLTYVDRLRNDAGLDERTARAHADALDHAIRESVATKADIAEVKDEIERVEAGLKVDIAEAKAELKASIEQVENGLKDIDRRIDVLDSNLNGRIDQTNSRIDQTRAELKAEIAGVRGEIASTVHKQTLWLGGVVIVAAGILFGLLRAFPPVVSLPVAAPQATVTAPPTAGTTPPP